MFLVAEPGCRPYNSGVGLLVENTHRFRIKVAAAICHVAFVVGCGGENNIRDAGTTYDVGNRDVVVGSVSEEELRVGINTYIDARALPTPAEDNMLGDLIAGSGLDMTKIENIVRTGADPHSNAPHPVGTKTKLNITCDHVNYSSTYFLYVPNGYDPTVPTSLVVIGHGGNSSMSQSYAESTASSYLDAYLAYTQDPLNAILVAPATTRGWGPIGYSLMFSVISKTQREYNIDPDKIYVSGQSMGGHLSWRAGLIFTDRFGAVAPQSGGYTSWIEGSVSIRRLYNTPGYGTWGQTEPYELDATNRALRDWLAAASFDWVMIEKSGGHTIYQDEQPKIAKFFADRPRDMYRKSQFALASRTLSIAKPWASNDVHGHVFDPDQPLTYAQQRWVELYPRADDLTQEFFGEISGNTYTFTTKNVEKMRVLVHPKLVDVAAPIKVIVNDDTVFEGIVPPNPLEMIRRVRLFDDRGRIYWGGVDIDITTDATAVTLP